jgi:hypothetical protein
MKSKVTVLYEIYRSLVGETEPSGRPITEGVTFFSPLPSNFSHRLWIEIVPDIHNPQGQYKRSASLRVFDPDEHTLKESARPYLELQAFEVSSEDCSPDISMFKRNGFEHEVLDEILGRLQVRLPA